MDKRVIKTIGSFIAIDEAGISYTIIKKQYFLATGEFGVADIEIPGSLFFTYNDKDIKVIDDNTFEIDINAR